MSIVNNCACISQLRNVITTRGNVENHFLQSMRSESHGFCCCIFQRALIMSHLYPWVPCGLRAYHAESSCHIHVTVCERKIKLCRKLVFHVHVYYLYWALLWWTPGRTWSQADQGAPWSLQGNAQTSVIAWAYAQNVRETLKSWPSHASSSSIPHSGDTEANMGW